MKYLHLIITYLVLTAGMVAGQTLHGARPQGLGGAYSAISDDPSALHWNPAGLSLFTENAFVSHYTAMYAGFCDDALGTGAIGYIHHFPAQFSVGISADMLYSDIYKRNIISLATSKKIRSNLNIGIRGNLILSGYNEKNFIYGEDDFPNDPFFEEYGYSKNTFGLDAGLIFTPYPSISSGLYLVNVVPPDLALSEVNSQLPFTSRFGIAYNFQNNYTFSIEGEFLAQPINEKRFNCFMGAEAWIINKTIGIRTGFNLNQYSAGLSYRNPELAFLKLDYAFIYPLSKLGEEASSHKISLSLGFAPSTPQEQEIKAEEKALILPEPVLEPLILPEPEVSISVSPAELSIAEITQVHEEEPLVPVVFFRTGSAEVDHRFDGLIDVIGERVANNPGIRLQLYGYFDPRSEDNSDNLSSRRAVAVKRRFTELPPEASLNIDVIYEGYSVAGERAGLQREAPTEDQQKMINHENRRVEFQLNPRSLKEQEFSIDTNSPEEISRLYGPLLTENPDIDLIIFGGRTVSELEEAFRYKEDLLELLPTSHRNRVFVSLSESEQKGIKLNADGVIYRPREIRSALEFDNPGGPAIITIEAQVPGGFSTYSVQVIDMEGIVFRTLEEGTGSPSPRILWDWCDENGNPVDSRGKYIAKIMGADNSGKEISAVSEDTIKVNVTNREVVRSRLLIVQFVYDEDVAQAIYLEDRLEYVTRKLLAFAQEEHKNLEIEIAGHTDILGLERRNSELSAQRAQTEYDNISLYLMAILGFHDKSELDSWMKTENVNITYRGYGSQKPYMINRWVDGVKLETGLGDNTLPEGRTINRRVVIEMELIKLKD